VPLRPATFRLAAARRDLDDGGVVRESESDAARRSHGDAVGAKVEVRADVELHVAHAIGYKYSHDDPDGVVPQQYPPDELVGVDYYQPTEHGAEREIASRLDRLRAIIRKKR
jgi:MgsA AAA+ ATPase C terminal